MKYRGTLASPIVRRRLSLLDDEGEETRRIEREALAKLPALAAAHGVALDGSFRAYQTLVLSLARAHVPGFRVVAPPGPPRKWDPLELVSLWLAVQKEMEGTGKTQGAAIKLVMKSEAWREKLSTRKTGATEAQLTVGSVKQLLKKAAPWVRVVVDAYEQRQLQPTPEAKERKKTE